MTTTFAKRGKEKMRQEKQSEKALDPRQRRIPGQDPDRAGIVLGTQPLVLV